MDYMCRGPGHIAREAQGHSACEDECIYHPYTSKRRGITDIYAG